MSLAGFYRKNLNPIAAVSCNEIVCQKIKSGVWNSTARMLVLKVHSRIEEREAVTFLIPASSNIRIPRLGVTHNDPAFKISVGAGSRSIMPVPVKKVMGVGALINTALTFNPPRTNAVATIIFRFE